MTGFEYVRHILDLIEKNPEIDFTAVDLQNVPIGTVRTIKVGISTVKYEVIAKDIDPAPPLSSMWNIPESMAPKS